MARSCYLYPKEPFDGGHELLYLLVRVVAAVLGRTPDAALDVVLEEDDADLSIAETTLPICVRTSTQ